MSKITEPPGILTGAAKKAAQAKLKAWKAAQKLIDPKANAKNYKKVIGSMGPQARKQYNKERKSFL